MNNHYTNEATALFVLAKSDQVGTETFKRISKAVLLYCHAEGVTDGEIKMERAFNNEYFDILHNQEKALKEASSETDKALYTAAITVLKVLRERLYERRRCSSALWALSSY